MLLRCYKGVINHYFFQINERDILMKQSLFMSKKNAYVGDHERISNYFDTFKILIEHLINRVSKIMTLFYGRQKHLIET